MKCAKFSLVGFDLPLSSDVTHTCLIRAPLSRLESMSCGIAFVFWQEEFIIPAPASLLACYCEFACRFGSLSSTYNTYSCWTAESKRAVSFRHLFPFPSGAYICLYIYECISQPNTSNSVLFS